ncbi:hypothetical protein [Streptomyces chartreusis]|uniref:hypothetical protein n=1 Tax=Streptomyces chartreusis TaxID=1969 RepID=UPI0033B4A806
MRNFQKAAVVMAMLGSVSFLGAGVGHASDGDKIKLDNDQKQGCTQNDAQTGLVQLDDVNVSVGLLGWSQQDNSEKESLACSQSFGK